MTPISSVTSNSVPEQINRLQQQISTGQRINSAADDAAGLVISTGQDSQIRGLSTAIRNANDGISLTQVASGALSQVTDNLQRIRELSLQAANGILNDSDRQALQSEIDQLTESSRGILEDTNFNGVALFDNESELNFQVGPDAGDQIQVQGSNLLQQVQGFEGLDVTQPDGAAQAIESIDNSLAAISERQSELGAVANRFESSIRQTQDTLVNTQAARSRITDSDLAQSISALSNEQVRNQAQIAVQAQANANAGDVLRLLG